MDAGCAGVLHEAFDREEAGDDDVCAVAGEARRAEALGEGDGAELIDEGDQLLARDGGEIAEGGTVARDDDASGCCGESGERVEGAAATDEHGRGRGVFAHGAGDSALDVAFHLAEVVACGELGAAEGLGESHRAQRHGCAFGDDAVDAEDDFHGAAADIDDGAEAVGEVEGAGDGAVGMFAFVETGDDFDGHAGAVFDEAGEVGAIACVADGGGGEGAGGGGVFVGEGFESDDGFDAAREGVGGDGAGFGEAVREAGHGAFFVEHLPEGAVEKFDDEEADGVAAYVDDGEALAGEGGVLLASERSQRCEDGFGFEQLSGGRSRLRT